MSVFVDSSICLFFFPEPWQNRLLGPIDQITIVMDNNVITVLFTVATGNFNPENGTVQVGATLSSTDITEEEREMLLHFALSYHALYTGCDNILMSLYYQFIGFLVTETLALHQPESAVHALEAAVVWLFENLPGDVFDHPDVEIPPITPFTEMRDPAITETLAMAPSDFSPTGALIEMCTILVPALTMVGEHANPCDLARPGQSILQLPVPPTSVSVECELVVLPTLLAPKGDGYESDDSMPSLRYITDSDSDFE